MLSKLPPRERQIVDLLYEQGGMAVAEICDSLPDRLSGSAVRAMLQRLERKGFVTHRLEDGKFVYAPALPEPAVKQTAVRQFIDTFFRGSPIGAAAALIGMSEKVEEKDLQQLEAAIARAREERGQ